VKTLRLLGRHAGALWIATLVTSSVAMGELLAHL
jgi:hypothetical protein